jgi:hypothetical protein
MPTEHTIKAWLYLTEPASIDRIPEHGVAWLVYPASAVRKPLPDLPVDVLFSMGLIYSLLRDKLALVCSHQLWPISSLSKDGLRPEAMPSCHHLLITFPKD